MNVRRRLLNSGVGKLYIFKQGDTDFRFPVAYKTSNIEFTSGGALRAFRAYSNTLGIIDIGKLDLSKYKKLIVEFNGYGDTNDVGVSHDIVNATPIISSKVDAYVRTGTYNKTEVKEIPIDRSWNNNYIFAAVDGFNQKMDIYNLWLEG